MPQSVLLEAFGHMEAGRLAAAADLCAETLKRLPEQPALWHLAGEIARREGRLDEAEASLNEALRLKPDYPAAWSSLALCHKDRGALDLAAKALREALRLRPDDRRVLVNLAAMTQFLDPDTAGMALARAAALDPADPDVWDHFHRFLADTDETGSVAALRRWLSLDLARHGDGAAARALRRGDYAGAAGMADGQVRDDALYGLFIRDGIGAFAVALAASRAPVPPAAAASIRQTPRRHVHAAKEAAKNGNYKEARHILRLLAGLLPLNVFIHQEYAALLISLNRLDEAESWLAPVMDTPCGNEGLDFLVAMTAGDLTWKLQRHDAAEAWYRRALDLRPNAAPALRGLGLVLAGSGRDDEAMALLARAREAAALHINDGDDDDFDSVPAAEPFAARGQPRPSPPPPMVARRPRKLPAPWPVEGDFDDYDRLVGRYILRQWPKPERLLPRSARTLTFGSCFAANIAENLRRQSIHAIHVDVAEEINTTFANRALLNWLVDGPVDAGARAIERLYGADTRPRLLAEIAAADVIILTVGVAVVAFTADDHQPIFRTQIKLDGVDYYHRTTTVDENTENLRAIINDVRRVNPHATTFLTLSPIPLFGTREMSSAIIADCLSKSILRASINTIMAEFGDIYYWPSFEMTRWVGANMAESVFDRDNRHINASLLDRIMTLFVDRTFEA